MKLFTGIFLLILEICQAQEVCYFSDGSTKKCLQCCVFDCCKEDDDMSAGSTVGIVTATMMAIPISICCICIRRIWYRTTIIRRTGVIPRGVTVAGYEQRRIPTISQPNPNQRTVPEALQMNPNHHRYDQQQIVLQPLSPPTYEEAMKEIHR